MASLYIDEDLKEDVAEALADLGHAALLTRVAGNKGATDAEQLAFAVREQRILVTCNRRDFLLLHEAWHVCARERQVAARPLHHCILLMPNERAATPTILASAIDSLLATERDVRGRFFRWTAKAGWRSLGP